MFEQAFNNVDAVLRRITHYATFKYTGKAPGEFRSSFQKFVAEFQRVQAAAAAVPTFTRTASNA